MGRLKSHHRCCKKPDSPCSCCRRKRVWPIRYGFEHRQRHFIKQRRTLWKVINFIYFLTKWCSDHPRNRASESHQAAQRDSSEIEMDWEKLRSSWTLKKLRLDKYPVRRVYEQHLEGYDRAKFSCFQFSGRWMRFPIVVQHTSHRHTFGESFVHRVRHSDNQGVPMRIQIQNLWDTVVKINQK